MLESIKNNLLELDFSQNDIKVYIALTEMGEAKAAQISKRCGLPRTTVISILDKLEKRKFISTHIYKGACRYWVESPRVIKESMEEKIVIADQLTELLSDMYRTKADFPSVQIFDTKNGVKSYIEKLLLSLEKKSIIHTIDCPSSGNYKRIFSDDYHNIMLGIKKKRNIFTRSLIPFETAKSIDREKLRIQDIVLRELPEKIDFRSSLWIIGDNVTLFSGRHPFLVTVKNKMIKDSIKSIYDFLWNISKEVK
jgi:sugar-specific transcriptional regulator TrmB